MPRVCKICGARCNGCKPGDGILLRDFLKAWAIGIVFGILATILVALLFL